MNHLLLGPHWANPSALPKVSCLISFPSESARRADHFYEYATNQAITQKTSFRDHEHRELHAEREPYARSTDRRSSVWRNLRPACGGCHEVRLPRSYSVAQFSDVEQSAT